MRDPKELTDSELREKLLRWGEIRRTAEANVKELLAELLRRKQPECEDGFWSQYGWIPNR